MIKLEKVVCLNLKFYVYLFEEGGDEFIVVYFLFRFYKNGVEKYYNEKGYKGLCEKIKLLLIIFRKYLLKFINLGLCRFDKYQQLVILGIYKINKLYKKGRLKLVFIEIGMYKEIKLFSFCVRILKME